VTPEVMNASQGSRSLVATRVSSDGSGETGRAMPRRRVRRSELRQSNRKLGGRERRRRRGRWHPKKGGCGHLCAQHEHHHNESRKSACSPACGACRAHGATLIRTPIRAGLRVHGAHHREGPKGATHHREGPRGATHHREGLEGTTHHCEGAAGATHHIVRGPRGTARHCEGPEGATHHSEGPRRHKHVIVRGRRVRHIIVCH
jgi:hypothetical protein